MSSHKTAHFHGQKQSREELHINEYDKQGND